MFPLLPIVVPRPLTQTLNHMKANQGILSSFVVEVIFILGPCFWLNWKARDVITQFLAEVFVGAKMLQLHFGHVI
jgi:hypothetical protein